MKVHKQITLFLTALLVASIVWLPTTGQAATEYSYGNNSCGVERGTDTIFVINDSDAMLGINLDSGTPKKGYVSESIAYTNSFQAKDRVGVIGFNVKAITHQSLTENRILSDKAFKTFLQADDNTAGGNNLATGIEKALGEFATSTSANEKVMIIMTTGDSVNNQKSLELARQAYENNVTIHVFGFGTSTQIDYTNLTSIAKVTGGSYYHSSRATDLAKNLASLNSSIVGFDGQEVHSDMTLTDDMTVAKGLLLHDNVKVNLDGYNLDVKGDLILQSCSELRAVSGVITANNVEQKSGSTIALNNSQLNVKNTFTQSGSLQVNGNYGSVAATPEVIVNNYDQKIRGIVELNGRTLQVKGDFDQEGRVQVGGGLVEVAGHVTQQGFFNVEKGQLFVKGNLNINGDALVDDAFTENRSLNVGGGLVQVGSAESIGITRDKGNLLQKSGQLYVNHGTVRVFGDYLLTDGWLTMIKGSMDTTSANYGEGDGDYVHVYRDFSTSSKRNHGKRDYAYFMKPSNDQAHLTNGVLRVDGNFTQVGNEEFNTQYSDRSQGYTEDYSRLNFSATGRHKVLLTGKRTINIEGTGFTFNILDVEGTLADYTQHGPVKYKQLIQRTVAANAKLASLSINGVPVFSFNPNVTTYYNHFVPADSLTGGVFTVKVDARAEDHRNAKVEVLNSVVTNGKAEVKVLVTAHDGVTQAVYTVHVTVGSGSDGRVTSIVLQQKEFSFMKLNDDPVTGESKFSPGKATIGFTIYPKTAINQQVIWTSTNPAVATVLEGVVTPVGIGQATIVATTVDGNLVDSAVINVLAPFDLLEGIKTFADLVSDNNRYNQIMSLYDPSTIGIVVPGKYIQKVEFPNNSTGYLISGTITVDPAVERVVVRVNGQPASAVRLSGTSFSFSRAGLTVNDYIEVIAYNAAGDQLEQIGTYYPVGFVPDTSIPDGFYSIQDLLGAPYLLELILERYALEQLPFTAR